MDWTFAVYLASVGINFNDAFHDLSIAFILGSVAVYLGCALGSLDSSCSPRNQEILKSIQKVVFPRITVVAGIFLLLTTLAPTPTQFGFILSTKAISTAASDPKVVDATQNAFGLLNDYLGKLRSDLQIDPSKIPNVGSK